MLLGNTWYLTARCSGAWERGDVTFNGIRGDNKVYKGGYKQFL